MERVSSKMRGRKQPCAVSHGHQGSLWRPFEHRGRYGGARIGARGRARPRAIGCARKHRKIHISKIQYSLSPRTRLAQIDR